MFRRTVKRRSTREMIISRGRCPFLSEQLRLALQLTLASLSASTPSVSDSGIPLLPSSNGVSPPPFHLLVPVKMPVSNLDCEVILHPKKSMSSRKCFNYCPYFTAFCGYPVENSRLVLWIKMWETREVFCWYKLRILSHLDVVKSSL